MLFLVFLFSSQFFRVWSFLRFFSSLLRGLRSCLLCVLLFGFALFNCNVMSSNVMSGLVGFKTTNPVLLLTVQNQFQFKMLLALFLFFFFCLCFSYHTSHLVLLLPSCGLFYFRCICNLTIHSSLSVCCSRALENKLLLLLLVFSRTLELGATTRTVDKKKSNLQSIIHPNEQTDRQPVRKHNNPKPFHQ